MLETERYYLHTTQISSDRWYFSSYIQPFILIYITFGKML